MCSSRSGQPRGLPGLRNRESYSSSPQEEKVLFSSPSPPLSSPPSLPQHLSDPSLVVLTWQRTISFLVLCWLVHWPGSWEKSRRLQGREGRGGPGSSVFHLLDHLCSHITAGLISSGRSNYWLLLLGPELVSSHVAALCGVGSSAPVSGGALWTPSEHPHAPASSSGLNREV